MRPWVVAALALGVVLPGETPPAPTHVTITATVSDGRGRTVPSLTAADFQVRENGAPLRVVSATWIPERLPAERPAVAADGALPDTTVSDAEASVAARDPDTRVLGLFLDEYHVAPEHVATLRAALDALLREQVRPGDLVLTVKPLDPLASIGWHRGSAAARAAVASLDGRRGDYTARNAFERELIAADPVRIDRARTRIALSAIQALVTRLAGLGARRTALLVVGEPLAAARPVAPRTADGTPSLTSLSRLASRANVAVSWLDPRGPRAEAAEASGGDGDAGSTPMALVSDSGGRTMTADDPGSLRAWLEDLGGYYLLTLDGAGDGRFHPIDVRTVRGGWRVRARPGYWAVSPDELERAALASVPPPPPRPVLPPVHTSRLIVPWVGQTLASDGRTRVSLVWEPAPPRAGERPGVLPPSRVVVRALLPDGTPAYEGVVQSASAGVARQSEAQFDVPPGRIRLQLSIEDVGARVLDTDVRDVVVAPFSGEVHLGTPRVFRTRTAREFAAVRDDPQASPVAARAFSRVERLLVRVPVYPSGGPAPATDVQVTAALLNRRGQLMRALPVTRDADAAFAVTDVPLAGLATGDYSIQWRAARAATEAIETVSFRVVP